MLAIVNVVFKDFWDALAFSYVCVNVLTWNFHSSNLNVSEASGLLVILYSSTAKVSWFLRSYFPLAVLTDFYSVRLVMGMGTTFVHLLGKKSSIEKVKEGLKFEFKIFLFSVKIRNSFHSVCSYLTIQNSMACKNVKKNCFRKNRSFWI